MVILKKFVKYLYLKKSKEFGMALLLTIGSYLSLSFAKHDITTLYMT